MFDHKPNEERKMIVLYIVVYNLLSTVSCLTKIYMERFFNFYIILFIFSSSKIFSEFERQELNDKLQKMYQEKSDW